MSFNLSSVVRCFVLALLILLLAITKVEAEDDFPRFGVIESYELSEKATELGVGWTRVRFPWAEVQPDSPDQWLEPVVTDAQIAGEVATGRRVVGLIVGIADWARDEHDLPKGLYLPHDHPDNTVAVYMRTAMERFEGQIDHWVIWNEPDIWDVANPGHTWHGTPADFAQLMRVAYFTAKDVNPDIVIHLTAFTYYWDANFGRPQFLDLLLTELDKDPEAEQHGYYFDHATAHLYFQPHAMYEVLMTWQDILANHGLEKDWWLIETNAPVNDDPLWPVDDVTLAVSQIDQANFMPQAFATVLAAGVDKISVFKMIDIASDRGANPEPFGLVREDGSHRPAFRAYQVAIEQLSDVEVAVRERWEAVAQIRMHHTDGRMTHVLFSRYHVPQTIEVGAWGKTGKLISLYGEEQWIESENGTFTIELPGSPCTQPIADHCMIGGDSFYLVQYPDQLPTATPMATPTPIVPTLEASRMPTPDPDPTETSEPSPTFTPRPTPPPSPSPTEYGLASLAVFTTFILLVAAFILTKNYVF